MTTARAIIADLHADMFRCIPAMPPGAYIRARVEAALTALNTETGLLEPETELGRVFRAFAALSGVTAANRLGRILAPGSYGPAASRIGDRALALMICAGLVHREAQGRYALTPLGRAEAERIGITPAARGTA